MSSNQCRRLLTRLQLHHLAGVGHLMGSAIHAPLSQWMYLQIRSALLAMTNLIRSLETAFSSTISIATTLRQHVQRIDHYMADVTRTRRDNHVTHSALPARVLEESTEAKAQADCQHAIVSFAHSSCTGLLTRSRRRRTSHRTLTPRYHQILTLNSPYTLKNNR
jgi:uncharacterized membrane-anchored protein YhcB (DUF1043 family)